MRRDHQHRVQVSDDYAWQYCVEGYDCPDEGAHGNIVRIDECRCGARRATEINGSHRVEGGWLEAPEKARP